MKKSTKRRIALAMALSLIVVTIIYMATSGNYYRYMPSLVFGVCSIYFLWITKYEK
jgi:hypothetical protein